jgi:hypothetical protein
VTSGGAWECFPYTANEPAAEVLAEKKQRSETRLKATSEVRHRKEEKV